MSAPVTPGGGAFGCLITAFLLAAPAYLAAHIVVALVVAVAS